MTNEKNDPNSCLLAVDNQYAPLFARIIEEHFPSVPTVAITGCKYNESSQDSRKDAENRRQSRSEVVFKSFQKFNNSKDGRGNTL